MSKWRINLEKVGRSNISRSIEITADTLSKAEQRAIKECGKHLMSRDIGLIDKVDLTYDVLAGFNTVGKVSIQSI